MQAAGAPSGVALKQHPVLVHDAEDTLVVGWRLALLGEDPVHQGGDAPVP